MGDLQVSRMLWRVSMSLLLEGCYQDGVGHPSCRADHHFRRSGVMTIKQKDLAVVKPSDQGCLPCSPGLTDEPSRWIHLDMKTLLDRVLPRLRMELNAILGFTQLLGPERADQDDSIGDIQQSSQKLVSFLELFGKGLLLETGETEFSIQPCSIQAMLEQIDELKRPAATKKAIEFKIQKQSSVPDTICCDPEWLRLSLLNFVDNAIQYTHQGEVVMTVSMGSGAAGERVKFEIRDTGIGISGDNLAHLFEPFWQFEQDTFYSFGLRLALTKRFAEALGGSIQVASELDKGTTFCLELPVEAEEQTADRHPSRTSSMEVIRKFTAGNKAFMNLGDDSEESFSAAP